MLEKMVVLNHILKCKKKFMSAASFYWLDAIKKKKKLYIKEIELKGCSFII